MRFVDDALARHARRNGGLKNLGEARERRRVVHAAEARVDADAMTTIRQQRHRLAKGRVVPRHGLDGRRRRLKVVILHEQVVRHHDRDGAGFARLRHRERLPGHRRDVGDVAHGVDALGHGAEQGDVVEAMDLEGASVSTTADVADDADERDAVEQGFAHHGEAVGEAGAGDDAEDAGFAGGAGVAVGHGGGGVFVGHERVTHMFGFERVPEFVLLGAGDAEDPVGAFAAEGFDERLGAGHRAADFAGHLVAEAGGRGVERQRGGGADAERG